ncbi:MAG: DUF72 domain-containing protein [Candidatus Bipolaricaulota bacterium]
MIKLHVGTSGWSYKHWVGRFYPRGTKQRDFLEYYAQHFDCVELNATFYRLPAEKMVAGWAERTPNGFAFCPKLSRLITHQKRLAGAGDLLQRFLDRLSPLEGKLGPILIQLPPSLAFEQGPVEEFGQLMGEIAPEWQFALEARHASWTEEQALDTLAAQGIAWVIADSGNRFPYHEAVTANFVYLRFHGPEELYASVYADEQLSVYADKAAQWLGQGYDVWAMFNNDTEAYAVHNARRLRELVQERIT